MLGHSTSKESSRTLFHSTNFDSNSSPEAMNAAHLRCFSPEALFYFLQVITIPRVMNVTQLRNYPRNQNKDSPEVLFYSRILFLW